jgi:hypothetical protein
VVTPLLHPSCRTIHCQQFAVVLPLFSQLLTTFGSFFIISAVGLWVLRPLTGLLYQPQMIGDGDCGEIGGMKNSRGNRSTRKKTCLRATLSTTNRTWLDQRLNPGCRGGKPVTNRMRYDAAYVWMLILHQVGTWDHDLPLRQGTHLT